MMCKFGISVGPWSTSRGSGTDRDELEESKENKRRNPLHIQYESRERM